MVSERGDDKFKVAALIYLLVLTAAFVIVTKLDTSAIRDLQRRVGQLESRQH